MLLSRLLNDIIHLFTENISFCNRLIFLSSTTFFSDFYFKFSALFFFSFFLSFFFFFFFFFFREKCRMSLVSATSERI